MSDMNLGTLTAYMAIDDTGLRTGLQNSRSMLNQFGVQGAQDARSAGNVIGSALGASIGVALGQANFIRPAQGQLNQLGQIAHTTGNQAGNFIGNGIQLGAVQGVNSAQLALGQLPATASQAGQHAGSNFGAEFGEKAKALIGAAGLGLALANAMNDQEGTTLLQNQLDLTVEEAARAGKVAGQLFTSNYGESRDDIKGVIREISASIGDITKMTDADLKATTGQAFSVAKIMGEETTRVVQIAGRMMREGLADSATEALDLIAATSQRVSGELQGEVLDAVDEYGARFTALGLDGSQAMALLAAAAKGGAIELDKLPDSLKEFQLLATSGSTATNKAIEDIGLNAHDMANQLLAGGDTAAGAFKQILDGLSGIEDPALKSQTAVTLFGSQLEDMGLEKVPAFIDRLADASGGLGEFSGKAAEVDSSLGSSAKGGIESFMRKLDDVGLKLGEEVLPKLEPLIGMAGELGTEVGNLAGWFTDLDGPMQAAIVSFGLMVAFRGPIGRSMSAIGSSFTAVTSGARTFGSVAGSVGKSLAKGGAFAGAAIVIGAIADSFSEARARAAALRDMTNEYTQALIDNGGVWAEEDRKRAERQAVTSDPFKDAIARGADYTDTMLAMTGDTEALNRVIADITNAPRDWTNLVPDSNTINALKDINQTYIDGSKAAEEYETKTGTAAVFDWLDGVPEKVSGFVDSLKSGPVADFAGELLTMATSGGEAAEGVDEFSRAASAAKAPLKEVTDLFPPMEEVMGDASEAASELGDKVSYARQMLDILSGRTPSAEQAMADLYAEIDQMNDTWDPANEGVQKLGKNIVTATGEIKTGTPAARAFREDTLGMRDAMLQAAAAASEAALAQGSTLAEATSAASTAAQKGYDTWLENATVILGSKTAAEETAVAYGLIPRTIATTVTANTWDAMQAISVLKSSLAAIPGLATISIALGAVGRKADGGIVQAANGMARNSMIAKGGANILWAEPETGWEAYISGKPSQRQRNQHIMAQTAVKLGGTYLPAGTKAFASGGIAGVDLTGRAAPSYGQREGDIRTGLSDLVGVLRDFTDTAKGLRGAAFDKRTDLRSARADQRSTSRDQAARVKDAEKSRDEVKAAQVQKVKEAETKLAEVRNKSGHTAEQVKSAEDALTKAKKEQTKANTDAEDKVTKATAAQTKANNAEDRKVKAAEKAADKAGAQADAATRNAAAAQRAYQQQERQRAALVKLGHAYDATSVKLDNAKDKLGNLRDQAASMSSSIADGLKGTGGGLTGESDKRKDVGSIINGLKFNQKNVLGFEANIKALEKKGLSSSQLSMLAAQGFDSAGGTVATLAGASKGDIAQINKIIAGTDASAVRTGKFVAKDVYGPSIARQEKVVGDFVKKVDGYAKKIAEIGPKIEDAVADGFSKVEIRQDPDGSYKVWQKGAQRAGRR